ncbi:hypothetical protein [Streptomyces sp. NPDC059639]
MSEAPQDDGRSFQHIPSWAPPLLLAGVDDDAVAIEEPHIVRGID